VFKQGLAQPTSDNYHSVHAPYWCMNILKPVRLMCFVEVLILLNQSNQGCYRR